MKVFPLSYLRLQMIDSPEMIADLKNVNQIFDVVSYFKGRW